SIGEGAADAGLVAEDRGRRALAVVARRTVPTGARIRRRDEHEPAGQLDRMAGADDRDGPVLERLAQRLERVASELAELVEEEHAPVGEGDLAGPRRRPASDEPRGRDRMVR